MLFLWTSAAGSLAVAMFQALDSSADTSSLVSYTLIGAAMFFAGLILLPSTVLSFTRLLHRPAPEFRLRGRPGPLVPLFLTLIFIAVLVVGYLVAENDGIAWLALPPLHLVAASLPLLGMVWLGTRGFNLGSLQTRWGSLASGLIIGPFLAILFEIVAGITLAVIGIIYITADPALMHALENLGNLDPSTGLEHVTLLLSDFLRDPFIVTLILLQFSVFVPLIEELVKPVAVWLLVWKRPLTPAQGFGLGLISGAGFALLENLFNATAGPAWLGTSIIRIGATAFHVATSGLMGYAIVRAKNESRYLGFFSIYALCLLLHGAWNAVVMLTTLASVSALSQPEVLSAFSPVYGFILIAIAGISLSILVIFNARLRPVPAAPTKKSKP
jgi:hypothetical protein